MENRFLRTVTVLARRAGKSRGVSRRPRRARRDASRAGPSSADQRALSSSSRTAASTLGSRSSSTSSSRSSRESNLLPESARQKFVMFIRDTIKGFTDTLLESAELALNRYSGAAPQHYGGVSVLRNGTASYDDLKNKLFTLTRGEADRPLHPDARQRQRIAVNGGITGEKIRRCGPRSASRCRSAAST